MEWVETTGKTLEDAKEAALERLGVLEEDADIEVLDEPKAGLFGRVRGEARVRARVRPTPVRQKMERRDRRRSDKSESVPSDGGSENRSRRGQGGGRPAGAAKGGSNRSDSARAASETGPVAERAPTAERPRRAPRSTEKTTSEKPTSEEQQVSAEQVGQEAVAFMEGLVSAFGLTATVALIRDGDDLEVQVNGDELGLLVGPRGTTLQSVQDLVRVAAQRRLGDHDTRLRVDVGGYRERRSAALARFALQMADEVKSSGVSRILEPMSSSDRRTIHDTLAGVEGIATHSQGEDPQRRVVIAPAHD